MNDLSFFDFHHANILFKQFVFIDLWFQFGIFLCANSHLCTNSSFFFLTCLRLFLSPNPLQFLKCFICTDTFQNAAKCLLWPLSGTQIPSYLVSGKSDWCYDSSKAYSTPESPPKSRFYLLPLKKPSSLIRNDVWLRPGVRSTELLPKLTFCFLYKNSAL